MSKLFYLGLVIILLASCKKDDSSVQNIPVEKNSYFPLKIGNYWIYKHYDIDQLGNETEMDRTDSVLITRDTIIDSKQYFVLEGKDYPYNKNWGILDCLRDSSGYIVNEKGQIKFSSGNFSDTLASKVDVMNGDTLYALTYKMERVTNLVTVPAGEFDVLNFKGTVTTPQQYRGIDNPRFIDNLYAENVGKVLQTYFYLLEPIIHEKRLVNYNIETE